MTNESKPTHINLNAKMHTLVGAHKAVKAGVEKHASTHTARRTAERQKAATEEMMMKDIPPGGIK
jgi:hypothetical protein